MKPSPFFAIVNTECPSSKNGDTQHYCTREF